MTGSSSQEVTHLLLAWRQGQQEALDKLIPVVYRELRRLAHHYMSGERCDHTLQTTALTPFACGMKTYDSGWFAVELDVTYTKAHNLDTTPFMVQLWFSDTAGGSGDVVVGSQMYACDYKGIRIVDVDALNIKLRAKNKVAAYQNAEGVSKSVESGCQYCINVLPFRSLRESK